MKLWAKWLAVVLFLGSLSPLLALKDLTMDFDTHGKLGFSTSRGPYLRVSVRKAKDLESTLRVYLGDFSAATLSMDAYKIQRTSQTQAIIPYLALSPGFKRAFLKKLWPNDKVENGFLVHRVIYPQETLWTVAQMYTGFGNNYREIKKISKLRSDGLHPGLTLKIPYAMLMNLLKEQPATPPPPLQSEPVIASTSEPLVSEPNPPQVSEHTPPLVADPDPHEVELVDDGATAEEVAEELDEEDKVPSPQEPERRPPPARQVQGTEDAAEGVHAQLREIAEAHRELSYGKDSKGRYAEYRLKKGEAIYSAVVVRFCGLVRAQDVNDMAAEIIRRNEIRDVTDMPIGASIRIPYDVLEPEYKATDDPEYLAFISNLEAVAAVSSNVASFNLEGVTIILDAGHGGRDPGADRTRVWEDDYVYDILCRVKRKLEAESRAKVVTTILDPSSNYDVMDVTLFKRDKDEQLNTTPPYPLSDGRATTDGVNLRWMMANSVYQDLTGVGADPDKILFASFHADALHHSIRGSMVYVPDARHVPLQVSPPSALTRFKESAGNSFSVSHKNQQRAQARSTQFASHFVKASRDVDVRVHDEKPIRSLIIRDPRRPFVPAILRYNRVPARVLIEICNISNPNDQNLLKRPDFRQKVADAFVTAVLRTYGNADRASLSKLQASEDLKGD